MNFFYILQVLFDGVLLFGIVFLFHYTVNHTQKKKEEWDIVKDLQVQELKENLQELLLTLKQLGKEVSENIQEQVMVAEEKTESFKKIVQKLHRDLNRVSALAEEVGAEKTRLEAKSRVIETAKRKIPERKPVEPVTGVQGSAVEKTSAADLGPVGFSSGTVKEVYRLADSDHDTGEIMRKTNLSRAEVQLILNLRGNRFTTPN